MNSVHKLRNSWIDSIPEGDACVQDLLKGQYCTNLTKSVTIQMKAIEKYFPVALCQIMLYKVILKPRSNVAR